MRDRLACVILAAGEGQRMYSGRAKVLHAVAGKPMLHYPVAAAESLGAEKIVVVTGAGRGEVEQVFSNRAVFVVQPRRLGTGDALLRCKRTLAGFHGSLIVLCGDAPLVRAGTLGALVARHRRNGASVTLLSAEVPDPSGYGRILRTPDGAFRAIREDKDCRPGEKQISEINAGAYVLAWPDVEPLLKGLKRDNRQGERYLTDVAARARALGLVVQVEKCQDAAEAEGINTRVELERANRLMNQRILEAYAKRGVTVLDRASTFIEDGVGIGKDTVIYPFTYIEKNVRIGKRCKIGPFAKIRSGSVIADEAVIGSFVELARSRVGRKTFIKHLAYVGDAVIGDRVNVGAGTVTANFDGRKKGVTQIGDGAFIGSNSVLVAPVRVGRRAKTGAGAVVLRGQHVADGSVVVGVPARPVARKKRKK